MTPFFPISNSITLVAGATPENLEVAPGSEGNPNVLYVASNDPTNSACINVGFGAIANAVLPNSGADGVGVVIGPQGTAMIRLNSTYQTGNLSLSAVSDGTVRLWISQGVL